MKENLMVVSGHYAYLMESKNYDFENDSFCGYKCCTYVLDNETKKSSFPDFIERACDEWKINKKDLFVLFW